MDKIDLKLSYSKTYPIIISNDVISRLSKYIDKSYCNRQIVIITQLEIDQFRVIKISLINFRKPLRTPVTSVKKKHKLNFERLF